MPRESRFDDAERIFVNFESPLPIFVNFESQIVNFETPPPLNEGKFYPKFANHLHKPVSIRRKTRRFMITFGCLFEHEFHYNPQNEMFLKN